MENLKDIFKQAAELLSEKELKDKDLLVTPLSIPAEKSYPIDAGDVTFSIGASASLGVQLFNDENDKDAEDQLILPKESPVSFDPATESFLKYSAVVKATANANVELESIGFQLKSSLDLRSLFYKRHANSETIGAAFLSDITHFRTIFRLDDVMQMAEGDVLCFKAAATVQANVKMSWSNIITQGLGSIADKFPVPLTLDLAITPSLAASFYYGLTDDFTYFIQKKTGSVFSVSLRKAKSTKAGFAVNAGLKVGFSKKDELVEQLDVLFDAVSTSVLGFTRKDVDDAIEKVKAGTAGELQKKIIDKLVAFLKLEAAQESIDTVLEKWRSIEESIKKSFETIAKAHVTLSVSYEYAFIREEEEIVSVTITAPELQKHHGKLLRFNLEELLDGVRNKVEGITLNTYLKKTTIDIRKSWGMGLDVFGIELTGKELLESEETVRENIDSERQVAIRYSKGYDWKLMKGSGKWKGEFIAKMEGYDKHPSLNQFTYGLQLNMALVDPVTSEKDLRRYFDSAVVWGAVQQADVENLVAKYLPGLKGKPVTVELKISFTEILTRILIGQIGGNGWNNVNTKFLAKAMARSLPYLKEFVLRGTVANREKVYASAWETFLANGGADPEEMGLIAATLIRKIPGQDDLANMEEKAWSGESFGGAIDQDLFNSLHRTILGFGNLNSLINAQAPYKNLYQSFEMIRRAFTREFYIRTFGAFLLSYAKELQLERDVNAVFTLTHGTGANERVINFSVVSDK